MKQNFKSINLRYKYRTSVLGGILFILLGSIFASTEKDINGEHAFGILLITAGILFIGWIKRVRPDRQCEHLLLQTGLIFPFYTRRFSTSKIRNIRATKKYVSGDSSGHYEFNVSLSGIKKSRLLKCRNPWFVRSVAEQLAEKLRVPFANRIYDRPSIRNHDEVNLSLTERWKKDKTIFNQPLQPANSELTLMRKPNRLIIKLRAETHNIPFVLIMLAIGSILAILFFTHSGDGLLFLVFFFGVFFYMLVRALLAFSGKSKLVISKRKISFRQGFSPVKSSMHINDIEEMIIEKDGITLLGDQSALWIHWATNLEDSEFLEKLVPYELQTHANVN